MATEEPKKRRRDVGDDGISWDKTNKVYVGTISLGFGSDGKRDRSTVRAKTKTEVKNRLDERHKEIDAGIRTPATYTIEVCVADWLDSIERDPHTMATLRGQAKNWINPRIGKAKLKEFSASDAEKFFHELAEHLSKRTLVMIKSTLRRSIRRAQVHKLIAQNVVELIDLPSGQPGRPSRAMTQQQASKVLKAASGTATRFVKVVKASNGRYGATHAATKGNELACGNKPHRKATITDVSTELKETTCRSCRAQLGLDDTDDSNTRLEALFVIAITLGLRPGELLKLTWSHVNLSRELIHVWRSASRSGDTKTPHSKRSLRLPKRAVIALKAHQARQDRERAEAGAAWHEHNLVFCHENGDPYTSDALNWRFGQMTKKAGIGHWHAHEGRHTAVSIMSLNGVPIQDISDTVGHKSTHVTETVDRHVIAPEIRAEQRSWTTSSESTKTATSTTKPTGQSRKPRVTKPVT
jgi:integrase